MNLNQVTIFVTDIACSTTFYEILGLKKIVQDAHYVRFLCPEGNSTFSLHLTDDKNPSNKVVIYFECENLDAIVNQLKKKGLQFDTEPADQPWLWREAYLNDPDGHRICLYYAGKNRIDPPWKIRNSN